MRVEWLSCYFSGVGKCVRLFWGGLSVPRKQGIYNGKGKGKGGGGGIGDGDSGGEGGGEGGGKGWQGWE